MRCLPAGVADQKNTVMFAAGMAVGQIGIGAFDAHGEIVRDEQVEYSVHAVRCNAFAACNRNQFGYVIS